MGITDGITDGNVVLLTALSSIGERMSREQRPGQEDALPGVDTVYVALN